MLEVSIAALSAADKTTRVWTCCLKARWTTKLNKHTDVSMTNYAGVAHIYSPQGNKIIERSCSLKFRRKISPLTQFTLGPTTNKAILETTELSKRKLHVSRRGKYL